MQANEKLKYYKYLLDRYGKFIWRKSRKASVDICFCDDIVQEVSLRLWQMLVDTSIEHFRQREEELVRGVAKNVLLMHLRDRKRRGQSYTMLDDADGLCYQSEESELRELCKYMTPDDQKLLKLYLQGFKLEEVAKIMGKKYSAVRQQKRRLEKKIRTLYKKYK
ncbi:MAG: sigma-70 family RNA polymerase sigma factor [Bacteroidales bacterium]|nr:sigma-70 family RNA polymerase sigma factor [Bacteroidales bacterium]